MYKLYCRVFQAVMKVANYFMGYRMPHYLEGAGKIRELGAFLKENVPRCREAHLLPDHNLGVDKNNWLEREGEPFEAAIPDDAEMERLRDILRRFVETVK